VHLEHVDLEVAHPLPRKRVRPSLRLEPAPRSTHRVLTEYSLNTALSSRARGGRRYSRVLRRARTQRRTIYSHGHGEGDRFRLRVYAYDPARAHAPTHTPTKRLRIPMAPARPVSSAAIPPTDRSVQPQALSHAAALQQPVGRLGRLPPRPPSRAADGSGSAA
jgi:hypothetical protein